MSPIHSTIDPAGLGPIPQIPLVPEAVLRQHHCHWPADHRFKAAARLLQSLWREDRDLPAGSCLTPTGQRRRLGSRLNQADGRAGHNFLHPAIAEVVWRELVYREPGALYDLDRLRTNLLSSMPLVFNAFAPLKRDLALATRVMDEVVPDLFAEVTDVKFEHAPARGHPAFTGDHTAFDLLIRGKSATGERAFVAVEVKYAESMREPAPELHPRYSEIAQGSDLFISPEVRALRSSPIQQLFRLHCLAQSMLDRDLGDTGVLLFIAPRHNTLAQGAAVAYCQQLTEPTKRQVAFVPLTLEQLIEALAAAGERDLARQLYRRYCDWWLLDGEIVLALKAETKTKSDRDPDSRTEGQVVRLPPKRQAKRRSADPAAAGSDLPAAA